tara:strand:+ start:950 stop:1603 length:654 start_codon:yes stop_codon:yes gene_type:complete
MDHSQHSKTNHSKTNHSKTNHSKSNPCTDTLTDIEYLEHMVPHHQVAIDMSNLLIPKTNNPVMLHLCRDITRKQSYEIWEMNMIKQNISDTMFSSIKGQVDDTPTKMDYYAPVQSKANTGECNPLFFKPNDHSAHMAHMSITDTSYLEHMIPHHQVAIDMSKRLLLHTNHSYLMDFCRKLIIDQQGEIFTMNNLLKNKYNYKSELLGIDSVDVNTLF